MNAPFVKGMSDGKLERILRIYLPVLLIFFFVARPLYTGWICLGIVLSLILFVRARTLPQGSLILPLLLYSAGTLISVATKSPEYIEKGVVQATYPFLYLIAPFLPFEKRDQERALKIFLAGAILTLPVIILRSWGKHLEQPGYASGTWGGIFRTSIMYSFAFLFILVLYRSLRPKWVYLLYLTICLGVIFFFGKRSAILGFLFSLAFVSFSLLRLNLKQFFLSSVFISLIAVFLPILGHPDQMKRRIQFARDLVTHIRSGDREILDKRLDSLLSGRYLIFQKAIELTRRAWEENDYFSLFFGFGIDARKYFPSFKKNEFTDFFFESTFVVSEYIARGVLGVAGVLLLFWNAFRWISFWFKRRDEEEEYLLAFLIPVVYHFGYILFNYFWQIELPLYLLFFGLAEARIKKRWEDQIQKNA